MGCVVPAVTWYEFDAVVACLAGLRRQNPAARFLIINHNAHAHILYGLHAGNAPFPI